MIIRIQYFSHFLPYYYRWTPRTSERWRRTSYSAGWRTKIGRWRTTAGTPQTHFLKLLPSRDHRPLVPPINGIHVQVAEEHGPFAFDVFKLLQLTIDVVKSARVLKIIKNKENLLKNKHSDQFALNNYFDHFECRFVPVTKKSLASIAPSQCVKNCFPG